MKGKADHDRSGGANVGLCRWIASRADELMDQLDAALESKDQPEVAVRADRLFRYLAEVQAAKSMLGLLRLRERWQRQLDDVRLLTGPLIPLLPPGLSDGEYADALLEIAVDHAAMVLAGELPRQREQRAIAIIAMSAASATDAVRAALTDPAVAALMPAGLGGGARHAAKKAVGIISGLNASAVRDAVKRSKDRRIREQQLRNDRRHLIKSLKSQTPP